LKPSSLQTTQTANNLLHTDVAVDYIHAHYVTVDHIHAHYEVCPIRQQQQQQQPWTRMTQFQVMHIA
jgi:hypothetical protein